MDVELEGGCVASHKPPAVLVRAEPAAGRQTDRQAQGWARRVWHVHTTAHYSAASHNPAVCNGVGGP